METQFTVVFDVGRVLVDFSFEPFRDYLLEHGAKIESVEEFITRSKLFEYELGLLSSEAFIKNIQDILRVPARAEAIAERWQGIFHPDERMLGLLDQLTKKQQTLLLSNTSELHWQYLDSEFRLESRAHGTVTSHREKLMKPNPELYLRVEERYKLTPERIVYIDDIGENTEAAAKRAWNTITHTDFSTTIERLQQLGISVTQEY